MSSQRFPGKVLHKVAGKPLLQYLLERLNRCDSIDAIVVATSKDESDRPIMDFCAGNGVAFYQGPLFDVAGRFKEVLDVWRFDAFVRICGDSPLLDWRLVDKGVVIFRQGEFDLVTNVLPRTYPPGQTVEVLRSQTFRRSYLLMHEQEDLEHVTRFFHRNRKEFSVYNFLAEATYDGIHLAVDSAEDVETFAAIIGKMDRPHWEYGLDEIVSLYRAR